MSIPAFVRRSNSYLMNQKRSLYDFSLPIYRRLKTRFTPLSTGSIRIRVGVRIYWFPNLNIVTLDLQYKSLLDFLRPPVWPTALTEIHHPKKGEKTPKIGHFRISPDPRGSPDLLISKSQYGYLRPSKWAISRLAATSGSGSRLDRNTPPKTAKIGGMPPGFPHSHPVTWLRSERNLKIHRCPWLPDRSRPRSSRSVQRLLRYSQKCANQR